MSRYREVN